MKEKKKREKDALNSGYLVLWQRTQAARANNNFQWQKIEKLTEKLYLKYLVLRNIKAFFISIFIMVQMCTVSAQQNITTIFSLWAVYICISVLLTVYFKLLLILICLIETIFEKILQCRQLRGFSLTRYKIGNKN